MNGVKRGFDALGVLGAAMLALCTIAGVLVFSVAVFVLTARAVRPDRQPVVMREAPSCD